MPGGGQEGPLITFYAAARTFQRVFRDASLEETKNAVKRKLKLSVDDEIRLTRIESGKRIDLEDEDDFEAFRAASRTKPTAEIVVSVGKSTSPSPTRQSSFAVRCHIDQTGAGSSNVHSQVDTDDSRRRKRGRISSIAPNDLPTSFSPYAYYHDALMHSSSAAERRVPVAAHDQPSCDSGRHVSGTTLRQAPGRHEHTFSNGDTSLVVGRLDSLEVGVGRARKKRKKTHGSDFRDLLYRSASNAPQGSVPPTEKPAEVTDELRPNKSAGGTQDPNEQATTELPRVMKPTKTKKRKRMSILEHGVADVPPTPIASRSKLDSLLPPSIPIDPPLRGIEAESSAATPDAVKVKKGKRKTVSGAGVLLSKSSTGMSTSFEPVTVPSTEPQNDSPVKKKRKKEQDTAGAPGQAGSFSNAEPPLNVPPELLTEGRKGKGKGGKKSEDATDGPAGVPVAPGNTEERLQVVSGQDETLSKPTKRLKKAESAEPDTNTGPASELAGASEPPLTARLSSVVEPKTKKKRKDDVSATKPAQPTPAVSPLEATIEPDPPAQDIVAGTTDEPPPRKPKKPKKQSRSMVPPAEATQTVVALTDTPIAGPSKVLDEESPRVIPSSAKKKSKKASTAKSKPFPAAEDPPSPTQSKGEKSKDHDIAKVSTKTDNPAPIEGDNSELWKSVQAAALAVLRRENPGTSKPPLTKPAVPEATETHAATAVRPKSRKENANKSKTKGEITPNMFVPALTEAVVPSSPTATSATAVETQPPTRKRKSKVTTTEDAAAVPATVASKETGSADSSLPTALPDASANAVVPVSVQSLETSDADTREDSPELDESASRASFSPVLKDVQNPMTSPLRPPAGSDVDEVAIQAHGEGSSEESSSGEESDGDGDNEAGQAAGALLDVPEPDVESLLRGPTPRKSILAELPSDSEDEHTDDEKQSDTEDEDEEGKLDKKYWRMSRRFTLLGTSSDEDEDPAPEAAADDEQDVPPTFMDVDPQDTVEGQVRLGSNPPVISTSHGGKDQPAATPDTPSEKQASSAPQSDSSLPKDGTQIRPRSPPSVQHDRRSPGSHHARAEEKAPTSERAGQPVELSDGEDEQPLASVRNSKKQSTPSPVVDESSAESALRKSPPVSAERTTAGEVLSDPIEPADDLVVPESPRIEEEDPIEPIPTQPVSDEGRLQSTPPPLPLSRPGTIQRMKNREGKVGTALPVKASELPTVNEPTSLELDQAAMPVAEGATIQRSGRRSTSAAVMPPPRDPVPAAPTQKRRGRPPMSQEARAEKERLAAEKKAEKKAERERIAAEKKTAKETEKAEKARLRQEKAAIKKGGKAAKATKSSVAVLDEEAPPADSQAVPETPGAIPISQKPGWTTLMQTPQTQDCSFVEGESMMIDELRSSSPPHVSSTVVGYSPAAPRNAVAQQGASAQENLQKPGDSSQTQPDEAVASSDPLFLPGSSQYPATPFGSKTQQGTSPSVDGSDASSDEEEEEATSSKVPRRPRHRYAWMADAPFQRLSDIATQVLFAPTGGVSQFSLTPVAAKESAWRPARDAKDDKVDDDDDEESDDDSDEDEDEGKKSHIPENRRAGANVRKKKSSALASFAR